MLKQNGELTIGTQEPLVVIYIRPLVNVQITMEHHHCSWVNQRTKWAMFNSYVSLLEENQKWPSKIL